MRGPDADYPLSYLYAEYRDRVRPPRTPLVFDAWVRDPAHSPNFRKRADVLAITG